MMPVFRVLFAAALLGVCVILARVRASKLELRSAALEDFMTFSRQLEALIRVNARTIPDALEECAARFKGKWPGSFAETLSGLYHNRAEASGLWSRALDNAANQCDDAACLTVDDRQIISLFGDQLVSSNIKSITESFALLYDSIGEKLQESERDRAVKGRLYRTIGMLAGLASAIVVI